MNEAAARVIEKFQLVEHPEGGWYRELFRSPHRVLRDTGEDRSALTVIHFLLAQGTHSRWHRIDADEAWFFSDGSPIEQVLASPDFATVVRHRLIDVTPVSLVPAGWWQAAYTEGDWALVQCAVAPGFEFAGFELAQGSHAAAVREDLAWLI